MATDYSNGPLPLRQLAWTILLPTSLLPRSLLSSIFSAPIGPCLSDLPAFSPRHPGRRSLLHSTRPETSHLAVSYLLVVAVLLPSRCTHRHQPLRRVEVAPRPSARQIPWSASSSRDLQDPTTAQRAQGDVASSPSDLPRCVAGRVFLPVGCEDEMIF